MLKNQNGNSIIIIAVAMTALLSIAALVVDLGMAFYTKISMQNTVDAAALAGAQELPAKKEKARNVALDYISKNKYDKNKATVEIAEDGKSITVTMDQTIPFTFAKIMGFTRQYLNVKAQVITAPISGFRGIRPLGIERFPFEKGVVYRLKVGAGDSTSGNYGALALGDTGSSVYENNLRYGYNNSVKVGDLIPTETGNMSNPTIRGIADIIAACRHSPVCTYDNYAPDCPKVIVIPVLDSLNISGRGNVEVVGFASFFLEGTQGSGGHSEVIGRFVDNAVSGDIEVGQEDYGARGVKLVR